MKVITETFKYKRVFIQHYIWIGKKPPCGKRFKQEIVGLQEWIEKKIREIPGKTRPGRDYTYVGSDGSLKVKHVPPTSEPAAAHK